MSVSREEAITCAWSCPGKGTQDPHLSPGFVTGGVLAVHTRPTPGAFNRGRAATQGALARRTLTDEASPGFGLGGLGSSHSAPMTGVANRASSPNTVTTHTKTKLHPHMATFPRLAVHQIPPLTYEIRRPDCR